VAVKLMPALMRVSLARPAPVREAEPGTIEVRAHVTLSVEAAPK
jgi:hypothetical protein